MSYFCYMVECADGSIYSGWTTDPVRRVAQHNAGRGAVYTRLHRPVKLVYLEEVADHHDALIRERELKKLRHSQKINLRNVK